MRVLIEYTTQTGKYRDHAWEALTIRSKANSSCDSPYAACLSNRTAPQFVDHRKSRYRHPTLMNLGNHPSRFLNSLFYSALVINTILSKTEFDDIKNVLHGCSVFFYF